MIRTAATIDTSAVTPEQIGRCHKILSDTGNFYLVESESDPTLEYKVQYTPGRGFSCTCPSGQHGFSNVHHPSGVCKHVRWAIACEKEVRAALAEQARYQAQAQAPMLIVDGAPADELTMRRVLSAKPAPVSRVKARSPRPFSVLR